MLAEHPLLKYPMPQNRNGQNCLYRMPYRRWRRMGVTLTGDAAHMMPPIWRKGQGRVLDIARLGALATKDLSAGLRSMAIDRAGQLKPVWQGRGDRQGNAPVRFAWPASRQLAWAGRGTVAGKLAGRYLAGQYLKPPDI